MIWNPPYSMHGRCGPENLPGMEYSAYCSAESFELSPPLPGILISKAIFWVSTCSLGYWREHLARTSSLLSLGDQFRGITERFADN